MKTQEPKENFILNLFDWRIKKLLALQYFKVLYLIMLILITTTVVYILILYRKVSRNLSTFKVLIRSRNGFGWISSNIICPDYL